MEEKEVKLIQNIYKEFTGYWQADDALQFAPMLFPFVEPDQKVRDAIAALECKKDKDSKFGNSQRLMHTGEDSHFLIRELERLMERMGMESPRYRKEFPEEGSRIEYRDMLRDMLIMLIPVISQKNTVSINLDINQLNQTIYGECENCQIRQICKEAFSIVTEYVSSALKSLEFQIPKEK